MKAYRCCCEKMHDTVKQMVACHWKHHDDPCCLMDMTGTTGYPKFDAAILELFRLRLHRCPPKFIHVEPTGFFARLRAKVWLRANWYCLEHGVQFCDSKRLNNPCYVRKQEREKRQDEDDLATAQRMWTRLHPEKLATPRGGE